MGSPNKSDYRRVMDHRHMRIVTQNPWRNPMKTGIVDPAYSSRHTVNYKFGHRAADNDVNPTNWMRWAEVDTVLGDVDGGHFFLLNPWNDITPGTRTINSLYVKGTYWGSDHVSATYIEVWRIDGANYQRVAQSADIGNLVEEANAKNWVGDLSSSPLSVTIEDGYEYFYGVHAVRTTELHTSPWGARTVDTDFELSGVCIGTTAAYDLASGIPTAGGTGVELINDANWMAGLEIDYDSDQYLEQDITADHVSKYVIPRAQGEPFFIKFEQAKVQDTNALTCLFENIGAGDWATDTLNTLEFDCGDTVAGENHLIYDGNDLELADIDPGGGSEDVAGEYMQFYVYWNGTDNDVGWQCSGLEKEIHFHSVKDGGSRGSSYTTAEPSHIHLSGTASMDKLRIGTNPVVFVGDSQCISGNLSEARVPKTDRWGGVPSSLTKERMYIMHGESGETLADIVSDLFNNSTPGDGDGRELVGLGCLWFFAGVGLNDILNATTESENDSKEIANQLVNNATTMLELITAAGDQAMLAGLPPMSAMVPDDPYEASAIRRWNRGLAGLALLNQCAYYSSWPDMVEAGTEGDDVPTFNADYTSDGGQHFNSTGGGIAAAGMVRNFEANGVDLRDMWD